VALVRALDGIAGELFFHKNAEQLAITVAGRRRVGMRK